MIHRVGVPDAATHAGHTDEVWSVAFSPNGKRIASGSADNTLRVWDAATGQPIGQPLTGHTEVVLSVAFSPDGKRIASGSADNTLRVWNADTGQALGPPLTGHTGFVFSVAFSPDGHRLATGSVDQTVRLWNADTGQPLGQAPQRPHSIGRQCGVQPRRAPAGFRQRGHHGAAMAGGRVTGDAVRQSGICPSAWGFCWPRCAAAC